MEGVLNKCYINGIKFRFRITGGNQGYRIYLLEYPIFNGIYLGSHNGHIIQDEYRRPFICWDARIITLENAKNIAYQWASNYFNLIYRGIEF